MQRRIRHLASSLILFSVSLTFLLMAGYQEFDLDAHGDSLTLRARNVPLKKILHEFEKQTHIRIRFLLPISDIVTVDFTNIPIDQAINLLLRNFEHSRSYSGTHKDLDRFISEIYVSVRTAEYSTPLIWDPAVTNLKEHTIATTSLP